MDLDYAVSQLLRNRVALSLYGLEPIPGLAEALRALTKAIEKAGMLQVPAHPSKLFGPPLEEQEVETKPEILNRVIEGVKNEPVSPAGPTDPPPTDPPPTGTAPLPTGTAPLPTGTAPLPTGTVPPPAGTAPPPAPAGSATGTGGLPKLRLEMTRIKCVKATWPYDWIDNVILGGGYMYNNKSGSLREWVSDMKMGEDRVIDPPHVLAQTDVAISAQAEFLATILLTEDDWFDEETANAMGVILSIVLTLGVASAIQALSQAGLPPDLTESAQKLLKERGISATRSWFEQLLGDELFEIPELLAVTKMPASNSGVTWHSYIASVPRATATTPFESQTPATHKGAPLNFKEAELRNGPNGPIVRVFQDEGQYEIDFRFVIG